jgi:hypothetical protein
MLSAQPLVTQSGCSAGRWVARVSATPLLRNRFGALRHHAATRHLYFRVVADQKGHYSCHDRTGRQHHKAERCLASRILDPADGIPADKAAETGDQRCTAGGHVRDIQVGSIHAKTNIVRLPGRFQSG